MVSLFIFACSPGVFSALFRNTIFAPIEATLSQVKDVFKQFRPRSYTNKCPAHKIVCEKFFYFIYMGSKTSKVLPEPFLISVLCMCDQQRLR